MQFYFDPSRESDPNALPDGEVFYAQKGEIWDAYVYDSSSSPNPPGWYYQACFPGCLPDGDPVGPFATAEEALMEARNAD